MVEIHKHTGTDSPQLRANEALVNCPQESLTTADNTPLTTGGIENLITTDALIIENLRTRLNEIETKLRAIGLIL